MNRSAQKIGFTLVELLAVIAVIGLLLVVTMPAFNSMISSTGSQTAVSKLRSTLGLARQWAITKHTKVYVVFPDNTAVSGFNQHKDKAYRSYAVYAVTNRSTGQGEYMSEWDYLPPKLIFDDDLSRTQSVYDVEYETFAFWPDSATSVDMPVISFTPNGRPNSPTGYEIFIREGFIDNTNNPSVTLTKIDTDIGIEVRGMTGGLEIHDYSQGS